jgi:hypothetical protein
MALVCASVNSLEIHNTCYTGPNDIKYLPATHLQRVHVVRCLQDILMLTYAIETAERLHIPTPTLTLLTHDLTVVAAEQ